MKYQGKRKDQVDFSNLMVMLGMVGIGITLIFLLPLFKTKPTTDIKSTHEYWLPGEDTQINDTLSYSDEYNMWIGGNGDTIWE
tara:strand:- start:4033 stop:4281 length:249 start_codon:yes stop_codon:yes gene_type:complete